MKLIPLIAGLLTIMYLPMANVHAKAQSAANSPEMSTGTGPQVNFGNLLNAQVGSMRFVGKVTVEGAKPLWDPIPIVVKCDGKTRYNTEADAKGNFDIQARLPASEAESTVSTVPVVVVPVTR